MIRTSRDFSGSEFCYFAGCRRYFALIVVTKTSKGMICQYFEIITLTSCAFALYYALQAAIAAATAWHQSG